MNNFYETELPRANTADGELAVRLRDISHTLRFLNEGRGSQRRILAVLREAGTITQRELTERLDIRSASASEVIAKLEDMGLITRTPSEEDRRTANIALTEAGRQQADAAAEQRHSRHTEMFSALTGEEKAQLLGLLEKLDADWSQRYRSGRERAHGGQGRREGRGPHHHHGHRGEGRCGMHGEEHCGRHEERRAHDKGCDHDCEHCEHPCGRGQARRDG